jgi:allantoicase
MDGWETRRRRDPGSDWCLVRLGLAGLVRSVVVDTTFFRGNAPAACTLEGCAADSLASPADLLGEGVTWFPLLGETPLEPHRAQRFAVAAAPRVTHVRLWIHPDGGVARLRVLGEPLPDLRRVADRGGRADLAAVTSGGGVLAASEEFFSPRSNLVLPGDGHDMGDGWETRRRRGPGSDWAVVRLAATALIDRVEVDTTHFKGNHPDACTVEVCDAPDATGEELTAGAVRWQPLLPPTPLGPHLRHVLDVEPPGPATHARLTIVPDGGVSRLRLWGEVTDSGWRRWGVRWLDALPEDAAAVELARCNGSSAWVRAMAAARPFVTMDALLAAADEVWAGLGPADWREALSAHPRIGERRAEVHSAWTRQEQARAADADAAVQAALVAGNRAYEERFDSVFVICATGRSAPEILAALQARLGHDPDTELRVAAGEQAAITRLRLEKMVRP